MNSSQPKQESAKNKVRPTIIFQILLIVSFLIIFGLVYSGSTKTSVQPASVPTFSQDTQAQIIDYAQQIQMPESYQLAVSYGNLGPQLLAADAIDYDQFSLLYESMGRPLSSVQQAVLQTGSDMPIVIDQQNAHFLLNFFWALGLVNHNPILTEGMMMKYGAEGVGNFASTGGWSLGKKPATELYASAPIIPLTRVQQERLQEVSENVYRPCCNNHTAFPDCNHGMAMLGLLTLLAGNDASVDEMFEAAKYVNAFWFPQQAFETAVYFKAEMGLDYAEVFPRLAVGIDRFSASGFQNTRQWLAQNNLLNVPQNGGNSCGVT